MLVEKKVERYQSFTFYPYNQWWCVSQRLLVSLVQVLIIKIFVGGTKHATIMVRQTKNRTNAYFPYIWPLTFIPFLSASFLFVLEFLLVQVKLIDWSQQLFRLSCFILRKLNFTEMVQFHMENQKVTLELNSFILLKCKVHLTFWW